MIGAVKKRTTAFLLSDFIDNHDYTQALSICSNKHDLTALQVYDKRDTTLPRVGLVKLRDAETGGTKWVNTSSKKVRTAYERWWYGHQQTLTDAFVKSKVDYATIATNEDYVKALMGMFKKRGHR